MELCTLHALHYSPEQKQFTWRKQFEKLTHTASLESPKSTKNKNKIKEISTKQRDMQESASRFVMILKTSDVNLFWPRALTVPCSRPAKHGIATAEEHFGCSHPWLIHEFLETTIVMCMRRTLPASWVEDGAFLAVPGRLFSQLRTCQGGPHLPVRITGRTSRSSWTWALPCWLCHRKKIGKRTWARICEAVFLLLRIR